MAWSICDEATTKIPLPLTLPYKILMPVFECYEYKKNAQAGDKLSFMFSM